MKKYATTLLFSFSIAIGFAQELTNPKQFVSIGLSGGNSKQLSLFSLPISYHHQLRFMDGFYYTAGIRQNLAFGRSTFTINKQETLIDDLSNYSINAMVGAEYHSSRLFLGFNIDLVGVNIGTRSYKTVGTDPVYKITPEHLNLAGVSGCTNNELYLGYHFTEAFAAKIGISYYNMSILYANRTIKETSAYVGSILPMLNIQYTLWQQ
jgi:hypothetical protein